MRFANPNLILFSVFFFCFVLANPVPDQFSHYIDPGCKNLGSGKCQDIRWCRSYREIGDIFLGDTGLVTKRDILDPEDLDLDLDSKIATRERDVN